MASSGNFCTLNRLVGAASNGRVNSGTMSLGNLKYEDSDSTGDAFVANMAMTGKTYCEVRIDSIGSYGGVIGLRSTGAYSQTYDSVTFQTNYSSGLLYHYKGSSDQSASGNVGGTVSAGNIVMFAYDPATYKWWVGVNGTWRNSGDPANGSGEIFTGSATMFETMDITWGGWVGDVNGLDTTWNFGQDSTFGGVETAGGNADDNGFGDFKYSPPTGFLALCTGNLSVSDDIDPAQTDSNFPGKQFNTVIYTGTGSTRSVSNLNFQPDLLWLKCRSIAQSARLIDSNRGVSKTLTPADTQVQGTETNGVTSFDSDGFTIGSATGGFNTSSATYVAWAWRCNGGTTSSDSSGDITVTRQTNSAAKFSILTYSGDGSGGSTVAHGLGVEPDFVIASPLDSSGSNRVSWVRGLTLNGDSSQFLKLNTTDAVATSGQIENVSSSLITVGGNANLSGKSQVLYAWANVAGSQKFGTWEGNASSDGSFVYTGFRPRMLFIKSVDTTAPWLVYDTARGTSNEINNGLAWNGDNAEADFTGYPIDIYSNGFKLRTSNATVNASGTWVFGAWGDVPFKYNNTF